MKAALIGDVHGNLPALEAVLDHARSQGVGVIWNIGDFVGYGPFPNQVVSLIRKQDILSIIGNYDQTVLSIHEKPKAWMEKRIPEKRKAFLWASEQLSEKNREYLSGLPEQRRLQPEGKQILLTHASPASIDEHLMPDTPDARLRELAAEAKADVIIFGHSHLPFARKVDSTWFINTGSVGRPDDGDPRGCYATFELTAQRLSVTHFRVPYDIDQAVKAIHRQELPDAFAQMLLQGVDLQTVLDRRKISKNVTEEEYSSSPSES